ncbi:MAG: deoxyhypusine synthase [Planctomycetota bacterium]|jgi:deoxyhypusine synthase
MCPTRNDQRSSCPGDPKSAKSLVCEPVTAAKSLDRLIENSFPSFGGAFLRRIWELLDAAIGSGVPMTLSVSGPVTLSGQVHTWLGPLIDTGWFAYISTTDAACYHDGHRALDSAADHPFHEVEIFGDDGQLRDERTIRVTDIGFDEDVLLEQDRFLRAVLRQPEFNRRMTGTEMRYLLGRRFAAQERANNIEPGLLARCWKMGIPIFVGAPADGSVFLNSVDLWTRQELGGDSYNFDLDLHKEVFESCAYHRWGLRESETGALGTLILGGGVPKNFNLQPEPALSQILGLDDVSGYLYDIQITTAPITDGSLSSCPPSEAVTWGKVDKDNYRKTCESFQCDYTIVMPFLAKALLDKRARFEGLAEKLGRDTLFERHPEARGYLRSRAGYRLFDHRDELMDKLFSDLRENQTQSSASCEYPLATPEPDPFADQQN